MQIDRAVRFLGLAAALMLAAFAPARALAHCDGMDGPVVRAAQRALATGNVNLVLIWVQSADEAELRKAFARSRAVRGLSPEAKDLADLYFFETLVRIHRAGESAPYTGLKPAGRDLGPAIPAADQAVDSGSASPLIKVLGDSSVSGLQERFRKVLARKSFNKDDVPAGREYVKAYVEFMHYVEELELHTAAHGSGQR